MNILYIHGFGSRYDSSSEKVQSLSALGTVYGIDLDYTQPLEKNLVRCTAMVEQLNIGLLVGTSMGGYMVSQVAQETGLPFVALNPCVNPRVMLRKYLGTNTDHYGVEYTLTEETLNDMPYFYLAAEGLVLLDMNDEVIPPSDTVESLGDYYPVMMFAGGSHRFEHMTESLPLIREFLEPGSTMNMVA